MNPIKHLLLGIACLLLVFTAKVHAQSEQQFTGSLLWKVSGNDITTPSYILGTHHMTEVKFLEQVKGFQEALDKCNVIVGEVDIRNKATLQEEVQNSLIIEAGEKGYKDLLTEQEYADLDQKIQQHLGAPLDMLQAYKPVMINTMLAIKLYADGMPGFNPLTHVSIDEHIQVIGTAENKKIVGLETVKDQIDALFSSPIDVQLSELQCTLSEIDKTKESVLKLNEYYEAGQLDDLYNLAFDEVNSENSACPISTENKHSILDNRNNMWLKKLPQLLKKNSNLIAVGALHLAGEEGLLSQLSKMGYKVEPVK